MGRDTQLGTGVSIENIRAYLAANGFPDAEVIALSPLGQAAAQGSKAYGYGHPLRVTFRASGGQRDVVVRTMSPDPFGHDRRADRAGVLLLACDTFNSVPHHVRALDVGAFGPAGELLPMARGEIFLITEFAEGALYAQDLEPLARRERAAPLDLARAGALARYLARLHGTLAEPSLYMRALRDTVGGGEGIFGLCDSYPRDHPVAPATRLLAIEQEANRWRWRLKARSRRCRRIHGDFHPFNILFREGEDFTVLDASRGGAGDPADDVTCLTTNYLAFAMMARGGFTGALRELWDLFWRVYLEATGDLELLGVVAPFFTWRLLVLASPVWYPQSDDAVRGQLLDFAERLLSGAAFDPARIDELLERTP